MNFVELLLTLVPVFFIISIPSFLILIVILLSKFGLHFMNKKGYKFTNVEPESHIIFKITQKDPKFNDEEFKNNVISCITKVYEYFNNCETENLMALESLELFNIHKNEIELGFTNKSLNSLIIDEINYILLTRHKIDGNKEVVGCKAKISYREICFDPTTKKAKKISSTKQEKNMYLEFIRSSNVKTLKDKDFALKSCPNCGAIIELNAQGKCIYCESSLINGEHSWVLNKIEPFVDIM